MRRIARLMELGRMRLDGKTFTQIAEHYNFSTSTARALFIQFERLTTASTANRISKYMAKEEAKELEHIRDWLEFLTKDPE